MEKRKEKARNNDVLKDWLELQALMYQLAPDVMEEIERESRRQWVEICKKSPLTARVLWRLVKNQLMSTQLMLDPVISEMLSLIKLINKLGYEGLKALIENDEKASSEESHDSKTLKDLMRSIYKLLR